MAYVAHSVPEFAVWDAKGLGASRRMGKVQLGVAISLAVHAALGVYLWKTKFEPQYREYAEAVTQVELLRPVPVPPPPPPAVEPPKIEAPPPPAAKPRLQPRPPRPALSAPRVAPLPVPPVIQRVEVPEPPAVVRPPAPPAPPAPPPPRPAPPMITQPSWSQLPSARDMARFYPERAQRRGVEGSATISCGVTATGALRACSIVGESPAGEGFGEAALKMSSRFKMRPMTRDGQAVSGGTVRIPIRFTLPD